MYKLTATQTFRYGRVIAWSLSLLQTFVQLCLVFSSRVKPACLVLLLLPC